MTVLARTLSRSSNGHRLSRFFSPRGAHLKGFRRWAQPRQSGNRSRVSREHLSVQIHTIAHRLDGRVCSVGQYPCRVQAIRPPATTLLAKNAQGQNLCAFPLPDSAPDARGDILHIGSSPAEAEFLRGRPTALPGGYLCAAESSVARVQRILSANSSSPDPCSLVSSCICSLCPRNPAARRPCGSMSAPLYGSFTRASKGEKNRQHWKNLPQHKCHKWRLPLVNKSQNYCINNRLKLRERAMLVHLR